MTTVPTANQHAPRIEHILEVPNKDVWVDSDIYEGLYTRFGSVSTAASIGNALDDIAFGTSYRRRHFELENRNKLGLPSEVPYFLHHAECAEENRLSVGRFVFEVNKRAEDRFTSSEDGQEVDKLVAVELGGVMQLGNWEAARPFVNLLRGVPKSIERSYPDARVHRWNPATTSETYQPVIKRYGYAPLLSHEDVENGEAVFSHEYGQIRRRRALADVAFSGSLVVTELYLESLFLVSKSSLDAEQAEALSIVDDPEVSSPEARAKVHSVCEEIVERGLHSGIGATMDVLPVSIHAVAKVRNPLYVPKD